MKNLLIALCLTSSVPAFSSTYKCQVKDIEEYKVEFNLEGYQAAFFDNDSWSIVNIAPFGLEDRLYFYGVDQDGNSLHIYFDNSEGLMMPRHEVIYGKQQRSAHLFCRVVQRSELNSGL